MDSRRKIVLASPREPCGATWLINCFLELGILTYRLAREGMWRQDGNRFHLNPAEHILRKWLPSLNDRTDFSFRPDIAVEWVHEWPTRRFADDQVVFFYRDPRDALYSRFKRESPNVDFVEYLEFLDPFTLLDKIENNCLFTQFWMGHPHFRLFRFEDYKTDAELTLRSILEYIRVDAADDAIRAALAASTAERAMDAEKLFLLGLAADVRHREARQVVNQGGIVGRWQELEGEGKKAMVRIEHMFAGMLHEFGYCMESPVAQPNMASYVSYLEQRHFFKQMEILPRIGAAPCPKEVTALEARALAFASRLTTRKLTDSGLAENEILQLINELADISFARDTNAFENVKRISDAIADNPDFYFNLFRRTYHFRALVRAGLPTLSRRAVAFFQRWLAPNR